MKYNITIWDNPTGWNKHETTSDATRVTELREEAASKARACIKFMGYENTRDKHFVYYYELAELNALGKKTGDIAVHVYMNPYMCDEDTFYRFVGRERPICCGAIHANNVCKSFFEK